MGWPVVITATAKDGLAKINNLRVRDTLKAAIRGLAEHPEEQGKPMTGELTGYRSLRAVGQRYRILYSTEADVVTVFVVALSIRKAGDQRDVYELAKKLLALRLIERPSASGSLPQPLPTDVPGDDPKLGRVRKPTRRPR